LSKNVYESLNDRELTRLAKSNDVDATHQLYFRYKNFVYLHWSKLRGNMEKINNKSVLNNLMMLKSDFECDSYIAFMDALNYVNLEKVINDKWKFLGVYGFYLSNLRRSYRRRALSQAREMSSTVSRSEEEINLLDNPKYSTLSAEDAFFENESQNKILYFWNHIDRFLDSRELKVSELKREGKTLTEIRVAMNLNASEVHRLIKSVEYKVKSYMSL